MLEGLLDAFNSDDYKIVLGAFVFILVVLAWSLILGLYILRLFDDDWGDL